MLKETIVSYFNKLQYNVFSRENLKLSRLEFRRLEKGMN